VTSFLSQEIGSQPEELARLVDRELDGMRRFVAGLPKHDYIVAAARGSSDHAVTYGRYVWGLLGRRNVVSAAPSLHTLYATPPRFDGALVIGVSQSGQSPDVVAVLEEARRQGRPTLGLTNDPASPLARASDHVVQLCTSPERSVAATKTYTAQLMAVALLAAALSGEEARFTELCLVPEAASKILTGAASACRQAAAALRYASTILPIARGINLCTAEEMALKLRELLRVSTHAFSAADFRHGSIALVTDGLPVALIMPRGAGQDDMRALGREIRARDGALIVISDEEPSPELGATWLPLATSVPEWLSPLSAVLPAQLLGLELVLAKGLDPDRPRGLADKVVRTL
jgi:glucosamine--fructose-6-phosphate aminotransferase (isomerizing)